MLYARGAVYILGAVFAIMVGTRFLFSRHKLGVGVGLGWFVFAINDGLQAAYVLIRAETGAYPPWIDLASWFNAVLLFAAPLALGCLFEKLCQKTEP